MAEELTGIDLDRWQVIKILRDEGYSFNAMVPPLVALGLIECHNSHRFRIKAEGERVCMTCENAIGQCWRRGLSQLAASTVDVLAVKAAWIDDHDFILKVCRERIVQRATVTTTRTETIDGKEVSTTTVREEVKISPALLRLLSDVQDKVARMAGIDIADPEGTEKAAPVELHIHERDDDSSGLAN